jgi:uncharacterized protein
MGHRHSPQAECGHGAVCRADSGSAEAAHDAVMKDAHLPFVCAPGEKTTATKATTPRGTENITGLKTGHYTGNAQQPTGWGQVRVATTANSFGVGIALFALRCYKVYLSFLFAGACRFEPTCSQYAYQAIERFGGLRGIWLGTKRLARCHPFSGRFGYDPVPDSLEAEFHEGTTNYAAAGQSSLRSAVINASNKDGRSL